MCLFRVSEADISSQNCERAVRIVLYISLLFHLDCKLVSKLKYCVVLLKKYLEVIVTCVDQSTADFFSISRLVIATYLGY